MPKQRKDKEAKKKRKTRRPKLAWDDERAQSVMEFLWGTWGVDDLRRHIAQRFPTERRGKLKRASQRICDIHCCGEGYSPEDVTRQLRKLMPREAVQEMRTI